MDALVEALDKMSVSTAASLVSVTCVTANEPDVDNQDESKDLDSEGLNTCYDWSEIVYSTDLEEDDDDPPSFYHVKEMNEKPVKVFTRLTAVPSQYHLAELRDYQAIQSNPYMLKMATSKYGSSASNANQSYSAVKDH